MRGNSEVTWRNANGHICRLKCTWTFSEEFESPFVPFNQSGKTVFVPQAPFLLVCF